MKIHVLNPIDQTRVNGEFIALQDAARLVGVPAALRREKRLVKRRLFGRDWLRIADVNALILGDPAEGEDESPEDLDSGAGPDER